MASSRYNGGVVPPAPGGRDKVDVDRVLNDIRDLRNRLFDMTPIASPSPSLVADDLSSSRSRGSVNTSARDNGRDESKRRDTKRLSSPVVLKNKGLEVKKSFLLDTEASNSESEDHLGHGEDYESDVSSEADADHHSNEEKRPAGIFSAKELDVSKRREDGLKKKLQESRLELQRKSRLEKDYQEVGEGLKKLAVEREQELQQIQNEYNSVKSQLKQTDNDLRKQRATAKAMERELDEARKSEQELRTKLVELEAKLQFESQKSNKLSSRLRAVELSADIDLSLVGGMRSPSPNGDSSFGKLNSSVAAGELDDERDMLIVKMKALVKELQHQLSVANTKDKDRAADSAEEIRRVRDELDRTKNECNMYKEINTRQQREIDRLGVEVQEARNEITHLGDELDDVHREAHEQNKGSRDKDEQTRRLKEEIARLEDEVKQTWQACKRAEDETKRLEQQYANERSSKSSIGQDLEDLRAEAARLRADRRELQSQLKQRDDELRNSRAALMEAESELQHMSSQMESLTTEMIALRETAALVTENERAVQEAEVLRQRTAKTEQELEQLRTRAQGEVEQLRNEYTLKAETERMNHLDALFAVNQEKDKAEDALRELMDDLRARDDEIEHQRTEIAKLTRDVEDRTSHQRHFVEVERQLEERLNNVSADYLAIVEKEKKAQEDNAQLRTELDTVKRKLDEMMEMIASREKRETSLHDKLRETETELATRTKELRRMGRALKHQDEKVTQLTEENEILRADKEAAVADLNSELERSRNELSECARSLVALEEEIRRLRKDGEKTRGADRAQLEHELRIRTEEIALLEREVIRLQSLTSRQQKEMVELERSVKDREDRNSTLLTEVHLHRDITVQRGDDVANLQHNVSTLTSRLKSQLDNLMRLQSAQPLPKRDLGNISNITSQADLTADTSMNASTGYSSPFKG